MEELGISAQQRGAKLLENAFQWDNNNDKNNNPLGSQGAAV